MKASDSEPLDTHVQVETPEHIIFPYQVAGPGPRGIAWSIDLVGRALILFLLFLGVMIVSYSMNFGEIGIGSWLILYFIIDWGWYTVCDGLFEGRTPGRAAMGLRVIREDGSPIGWREAILRNLLRPADAFPGIYAVGVLTSMADPRFRRLGDLVAGTLVVHTSEARSNPPLYDLLNLPERDLALLPSRIRLSIEEQTALERWCDTRLRLGSQWGAAVAERVVNGFRARHRVSHPDPVRNLELLVWAGRQKRSLEDEPPCWEELRRLTQGTFSFQTPTETSRLLAAYRSACADLGRRGASLSPAARAPLEALCAQAHATVYRVPPKLGFPKTTFLLQTLLSDFPAEVRQSRRFVMASAALFLVPMLTAGFMAAGSPEFAHAIMPVEVRMGLEASYQDAPSRTAGENAMMAGFYVFNNVGIALRSIGAGMFFGLGTAWVLIYNGLMIGAVAGYLAAAGMGDNLLRFTSGHSAWELTALVIAGGAGLKIGWSLISTHGRSRLASLRAAGPAVARLAAGAAMMLLVAAMIEGFWSAQTLPDWARIVFAFANFSAVFAWLVGVGQGAMASSETTPMSPP